MLNTLSKPTDYALYTRHFVYPKAESVRLRGEGGKGRTEPPSQARKEVGVAKAELFFITYFFLFQQLLPQILPALLLLIGYHYSDFDCITRARDFLSYWSLVCWYLPSFPRACRIHTCAKCTTSLKDVPSAKWPRYTGTLDCQDVEKQVSENQSLWLCSKRFSLKNCPSGTSHIYRLRGWEGGGPFFGGITWFSGGT